MILVVAATCRKIPEHVEAICRTRLILKLNDIETKSLLLAPNHTVPNGWMYAGGDGLPIGWSIEDYNRFMLFGLCDFVGDEVSHVMTVHADGYALHPEKWTIEFLEYDYIGAPWPGWMVPDRSLAVGNGGFSLRSQKFLRAWRGEHPNSRWWSDPRKSEDVWACRTNRAYYESKGIRFAPIELAARFSMEHPIEELPNATIADSFGFHGSFFKR